MATAVKIIAVIPAFNEKSSIAAVVRGARQYCDEVIVVDDGSSDGMLDVLLSLDIPYQVHAHNRGQGAATRTGIELARILGADIIVTLDGDGQHDPTDIPKLIAPLLLDNPPADVVLGSRFTQISGVPEYRRFGIRMITWLFNVGYRTKVSDALLCIRAFRSSVFNKITIEEDGFGFCPEVVLKARHEKFKIVDVPINCIYHAEYSRNSTFGPFKLAAILVCKIILWRIKIGR